MKTKKQTERNPFSYWHSLYCPKAFQKRVGSLSLFWYSLFLLIILAIINSIKGVTGFLNFNLASSLGYTLIGVPLLLLAIFVFFYLFISAFEEKRKNFLQGLFVFSIISLHTLIIGHILNWLRVLVPQAIEFVFVILILLLIIWYVVHLLRTFKNFYATTAIRVLVSFMLVDLVIVTLGTLQYVTYLIFNLK